MSNEIKGYPTIELGVKPKNKFESILQFIGVKPAYRKYELTPVLIGVRWRISNEVVKLPGGSDFFKNVPTGIIDIHNDCLDILIRIIGYGMTNINKEPSKKLLKRIGEEFTNDELNLALQLVIVQCNIPGFIACLQLFTDANVLVIPNNPAETIK